MVVISNEPNLREAFFQYIIDKSGDFGSIIHIELISRQASSAALGRAVHKQNGNIQTAEHLVVIPVKHLNAHDPMFMVIGRVLLASSDPEAFTQEWSAYVAKGKSGRCGVCFSWDVANIASLDGWERSLSSVF